jgi:hypothetical protein
MSNSHEENAEKYRTTLIEYQRILRDVIDLDSAPLEEQVAIQAEALSIAINLINELDLLIESKQAIFARQTEANELIIKLCQSFLE